MQIPSLTLNNGTTIPQIGLGTWPMDNATASRVVYEAARLGYRHFDTATKYGNERGVGSGLRASGLSRDDVFVTTKLNGDFQGGDRAVRGLDAALDRLGLDEVDLLLIHWPLPARDEFVSTWRTFEALAESGRARSIGVSNFTEEHLRRLIDETGTVPAVNQIQVNPQIPRLAQRDFAAAHGIVTECWSPLGSGKGLLESSEVGRIARAHGRSPAQVVLRWHIQYGMLPLPRSTDPGRLAQNLEVLDFELSPDDVSALDALAVPGAGVDARVEGH